MTRTIGASALRPANAPSRRLSSRIDTAGDVWVCWQCHGREDISLVRNLSLGGLFIETPAPSSIGVSTRLHFLVGEGEIRADAVVRHAQRGSGLGLKFMALHEKDRPNLAALLTRLRQAQRAHGRL